LDGSHDQGSGCTWVRSNAQTLGDRQTPHPWGVEGVGTDELKPHVVDTGWRLMAQFGPVGGLV